jgi:hypothetical protein
LYLAVTIAVIAILNFRSEISMPSGALANPDLALNLAIAIAFGAINFINHSMALLMNSGMANNAKRNKISPAISNLRFIAVPFV